MKTVARNTRTMPGAVRAGLGILLMLVVAFPPAHAEDVVMPTQVGDIVFGSQWWDQDHPEAKYREFQDLSRGPLLESFQWRDWGGPTQWLLTGSNAMRDDQSTKLGLARGTRLRMDLKYMRIPHLYSLVARSPYTQVAPGTFRLPDSLQRTNQEYPTAYNATMTDLMSTAARAPLDIRTDATRGRVKARLAPGWTFQLRGEDRRRTGAIAYGGSFGQSNVIELPAPVNHRTVDAEASSQYTRDRWNAEVALGLTTFENRVGTLVWDNPKRVTDGVTGGAASGQMDLAPDSRSLYGRLAFGWRLAPTTMLSATGSMSTGKQDDPWLPFTINSTMPQRSLDSLPADNADAKFVRTTADLRLTSHPTARLGGTLRLRYHDYDNQTKQYSFIGRARYDESWTPAGPEGVRNHAFGNRQVEVGADIDFDLARWIDLTALLEQRQREHAEREVDKDSESAYGLKVRTRAGDALTFNGSYRHATRELDEFHEDHYQEAGAFIEQRDLRRFDVANRTQDLAAATLGWMATDDVELAVDYSYMNNDFPDSRYGLQREIEHLVVGVATVHAGDNADVSGGFGFSRTDTRQQSNESSPTVTDDALTDWWANISDKNWHVFGGADWWAVPRRVRLTADYTMTRDFAEYRLSNGAGTAQDLPATYYLRHDVLLQARYRLRFNLDLTARYRFDWFRLNDPTTENIPLLGIVGTSTAVYLGDGIRDYSAHLVALVATRRF